MRPRRNQIPPPKKRSEAPNASVETSSFVSKALGILNITVTGSLALFIAALFGLPSPVRVDPHAAAPIAAAASTASTQPSAASATATKTPDGKTAASRRACECIHPGYRLGKCGGDSTGRNRGQA